MKALRYRAAFLVVIACLVLASAAYADVQLMDFFGFDWFWPSSIGTAGSCYAAVGLVTSVNPTFLSFDYGTYEYTFNWDYACFVSADTFGTTAVYTYDTSTSGFDVYCDSLATGTAADYGINPPNTQAPATWTDGELVLEGMWEGDVTIVLDITNGTGTVNGTVMWVGGSQLSGIPMDSRSMSLVLTGLLFDPPNGPEGYHWQVDGQVFIQEPTPVVEPSTWGSLKTKFQGGN